MSTLDLRDIQGNIHRPYGRYGFPYARYFLFHINRDRADPRRWDGEIGRWLVDQIRPAVTTAEPWRNSSTPPDAPVRDKPKVALNIAFTWKGLTALDLPTATLRLMPDEFIEGMAARKTVLGDLEASDPENWDTVWRDSARHDDKAVHVWVSLNAQAEPTTGRPVRELDVWTEWLIGLAQHPFAAGRLVLLDGHGQRPDGRGSAGETRWQDSSTVMATLPGGAVAPTAKEHFGFTDGISDPIFIGQDALDEDPAAAVGSGKIRPGAFDPVQSWEPLAAGEFILGLPSEGQELPTASVPGEFMRNGTFMALRKLHQNTASYDAAMQAHADAFARVAGIADIAEAKETLRAKMVGRWPSGVPLIVAPTKAEERRVLAQYPALLKLAARQPMTEAEKQQCAAFDRMLRDYRYIDDPAGIKCPLGAHVRRVNPRDMLDPDHLPGQASTALTNRRRILRRGLPYGDGSPAAKADDKAEHGVFIMALCTSLFRQFEFIQQQWLHYGLDLDSGNDTCPITGRRDPENPMANKFVVQSDPASGRPPYIAANLPLFVETHGGEYFFIPSITALRMIAMGSVDPT